MNSFILGQAHFDFRNRPDEIDEFIYIQPNRIITRNT